VQTSLQYPGNDPTALVTYRAGGQAWKWTASYEAMVDRFDLVDPAGRAYRATPAGTYRFVVDGQRRSGNRNAGYHIISDTFQIEPWHGITVENATRQGSTLSFDAGPRHTVKESHIRGSSTHSYGDVTYTIGPVDFPDHAANQAATGFATAGQGFLDTVRGYSASDTNPQDAEHYCLDCRFRDWLDATGDLTAIVYHGKDATVLHSTDGHFVLHGVSSARVVIRDLWGDDSGAPVSVG
jgi:hypothetical protein